MTPEIFSGGLHISFEMRLDAEQIARMPPEVIRALLNGVAAIVTAKEYAPKPALEAPANGQ